MKSVIKLSVLLSFAIAGCKPQAQESASSEVKSTNGKGNAEYELQNWTSNKCLDVADAQNHNGADVLLYHCNNQWNQRWRLTEVAPGEYQIKSQGGRCLDLKGGNGGDWTGFQVWDCHWGSPNQTFWLDKVKWGSVEGFQVVSKSSFKVLHHGSGDRLQQAPRGQTGDWQVFKLNRK